MVHMDREGDLETLTEAGFELGIRSLEVRGTKAGTKQTTA